MKYLRTSAQLLRSKNEDIQNLNERLNKEQAKIDQLKKGQGPNNETEIKRKQQLVKNLEKDLKSKKKEVAELQKKIKSLEKAQEKIDQLQTSISEEERKRNAVEERLNSTKTFDALKEQESHLQRLNEEDQAIIQDEMASSFDKEAAEERVAARHEELARLQTQIAEREAAMPLRERVKEIFIAAGVTIGAVIGAITNALKAMGKQMANGLKTLGAKASAALPGLIGAIVSFLFKTAGQAIGFLAEHTWLLILAVVAFLVSKLKRR